LVDQHFDSFQQVYDERYQAKYGYWRPIIEQSVTAISSQGECARRQKLKRPPSHRRKVRRMLPLRQLRAVAKHGPC
jgi:hypothetical protein